MISVISGLNGPREVPGSTGVLKSFSGIPINSSSYLSQVLLSALIRLVEVAFVNSLLN